MILIAKQLPTFDSSDRKYTARHITKSMPVSAQTHPEYFGSFFMAWAFSFEWEILIISTQPTILL